MHWIRETLLASDKIQPQDVALLLLSDEPQEICHLVMEAYQVRCAQAPQYAMTYQEPCIRELNRASRKRRIE
jgi:hypothetical protein